MILPETVKIGPYTFKVIAHDDLKDDGTKCWGTIKYADGNINIETGHSDEHTRVTLLHEVLHGIDHAGEIGLKEKQIRRLAPALVAFLMDNGWLKE